MEIKVMKEIMGSNRTAAGRNRRRFERMHIYALNIMASPGAGKTSIVLKMIGYLGKEAGIYVIEGDVASDIDKAKIMETGTPVIQINTGGGCHLDAWMIRDAADRLDMKNGSLLVIENVGNLICPSSFDLGEQKKILVASVPEGHDKPFKYTSMFASADAVILNKVDLMDGTDFDKERFYAGVRALNAAVPVFETSCVTGEGIPGFIEWIKKERAVWLEKLGR